MKTIQLYILTIAILLTQTLTAQFTTQDNPTFESDTIPFTLTTSNNIAIPAIINEVDTVSLMLHTAANDISVIKEFTARPNSIQWTRKVDDAKSWGGSGGEQRASVSNTLQIGKSKWDSLVIWESMHSGPNTDGKFGLNLFEGKHIELDFESNHLIIHNTLPEKTQGYEKLPLQYENGFMFIEATSIVDGVEIKNRFLIHSGYAGAILYDDVFVAENNIQDKVNITEQQELKDSFDD